MSEYILDVKDLKTSFFTHVGEVQAVRGVSIQLKAGASLGIVGESGCGKSVMSLSIMGLVPKPGKIVGGEIIFEGQNLVNFSDKQMRSIRGERISMIFQDPMTSLNPVYTIGNQITEMLFAHRKMTKKEANERAVELLGLVGIPSPGARLKQYPHEFSGGMRQRAMIAMALACNPALFIADEPTTALDVTIQAQILELMKDLRHKINSTIILITHDLGVVADLCDDIKVMYAGLVVEEGTTRDLFYNAQHPYTWGLLKSIPKITADSKARLHPINGQPPDLLSPPVGCAFAARCPHAMCICRDVQPQSFTMKPGHNVSCWLLHPEAKEQCKAAQESRRNL